MKVLTCLKEEIGIQAPRPLHLDFEIAVVKAIRDVFPDRWLLHPL